MSCPWIARQVELYETSSRTLIVDALAAEFRYCKFSLLYSFRCGLHSRCCIQIFAGCENFSVDFSISGKQLFWFFRFDFVPSIHYPLDCAVWPDCCFGVRSVRIPPLANSMHVFLSANDPFGADDVGCSMYPTWWTASSLSWRENTQDPSTSVSGEPIFHCSMCTANLARLDTDMNYRRQLCSLLNSNCLNFNLKAEIFQTTVDNN